MTDLPVDLSAMSWRMLWSELRLRHVLVASGLSDKGLHSRRDMVLWIADARLLVDELQVRGTQMELFPKPPKRL